MTLKISYTCVLSCLLAMYLGKRQLVGLEKKKLVHTPVTTFKSSVDFRLHMGLPKHKQSQNLQKNQYWLKFIMQS